MDINDNLPVFLQQEYQANVTENEPAGEVLFTVQAMDRDIGSNGEIRFVISTSNVPFTVNSTTGVVTTTKPLDRENISSYSFTITAYDLGSPSLNSTAQADIHVLDVNDNDPVFTLPVYSVEVFENAPSGTQIGQVIANDNDIGENGRITYSIVGQNMCPSTAVPTPSPCLFNINPSTGEITLRQMLNFEQQKVHNITVLATDNGSPLTRSASAQFIVTVLNVDESGPEFDAPCNVNISETNVKGNVTTCQATDHDLASGRTSADIVYAITGGNTANTFSIGSNGIIRNIRPLDREERSEYNLTITATDPAGFSASQIVSAKSCYNTSHKHIPYFAFDLIIGNELMKFL